jgi:hypothetical protein
MEKFNLLEFSTVLIFPSFMVADTFLVAPGGVVALAMQYLLYSVISFIIMMVLCFYLFVKMTGIELGA